MVLDDPELRSNLLAHLAYAQKPCWRPKGLPLNVTTRVVSKTFIEPTTAKPPAIRGGCASRDGVVLDFLVKA